MALRLPGLQPMPHRSPDKGFTPLPGSLSPLALRLPGLQPVHTVALTRNLPRRPGASPRWRYAYRGYSRCHTVAGQGIYPAARESLPGGATLTGATAGAHRSPGKGFTPPPGSNRFVGQVRRSRHLAKNGHHGAPGYSTSSSHFCAGVRRLAVSGFNQSRWSCCALSWRSMYKPCSTRLLLPVILQVPPCQVCAL